AIIPVHLYGHPADMGALTGIARRHKVALVEDAAEAHGALCGGKPVGSIGDIGIFSFYGNKIVTTGEGGMVVTNSDAMAEKMRLLRDHGMSAERRYWHTVLGYNYRLTSLQAALGLAQMERISDVIDAKLKIADLYRQGLEGVPGMTLPACASWARNVYWLYSIVIDAERFGYSRDALMDLLKERGIDTRPFFPPLHKQPIYANSQHLPVSERLGDTGLSLPSSANLRPEHVARVCEEIVRIHQEAVKPNGTVLAAPQAEELRKQSALAMG
ncbi:MAG: DegT/DnrJ/EryC1/StrS family aminotransferase, partial [Patescibacteria group bacterium]